MEDPLSETTGLIHTRFVAKRSELPWEKIINHNKRIVEYRILGLGLGPGPLNTAFAKFYYTI